MQRARETRGALIVNIDPRRTATSEGADLQLSLKAGTDTILFAWLLACLVERGALDAGYVARHTTGFDEALAGARAIAPDLETCTRRTGLDPADIERFVAWFVARERVVTCYSQGVNQSAQGTDKVNAILNCHLATGRIGRPGSGPLSLTGQPNAMGGREVGGLANMLAAHMDFTPSDIARVRLFWDAPAIATAPGLKAVQMFEAIERGQIKALWVMHTNPAATLPRADAVRAALGRLDLLVVSEACARTDTTTAAHVLLPAAAWGEKDGTVTNSERRISRQRAFLPVPGEAKPDWEHVALVARRMGFPGFDHAGPAAIFREHATLSALDNDGRRDFDIGALADIDAAAYDDLAPFHWPWRHGQEPRARFFKDGAFYTADGRARLVATADPALATPVDARFPFILNTGRVRDHWHTMTRTGRAPTLARHVAEPTLAIHPDDAASLGVARGDHLRVESAHGAVTLRVEPDDGLARGHVFAPFHWTDATAGLARIGAVTQSATDPVSGQPEMKATPVALTRIAMACEGFLLARRPVAIPLWLQHVRVRLPNGEAILFASTRDAASLNALLVNHLGEAPRRAAMADGAAGEFRTVSFADSRLNAALFIGPRRDAAMLDWLIDVFAQASLDEATMRAVLAGRLPQGGADLGPLICACFGVRQAPIVAALRDGAADVEAIGAALKAGTNCGSCRPEIKRVIRDERIDA
jgi:assimilatory nitrate reductase catalytic subunit